MSLANCHLCRESENRIEKHIAAGNCRTGAAVLLFAVHRFWDGIIGFLFSRL